MLVAIAGCGRRGNSRGQPPGLFGKRFLSSTRYAKQISFASARTAIPNLIGRSLGAVSFGAVPALGHGFDCAVQSIAAESGVPAPDFFSQFLDRSLPVRLPVPANRQEFSTTGRRRRLKSPRRRARRCGCG